VSAFRPGGYRPTVSKYCVGQSVGSGIGLNYKYDYPWREDDNG